MQPNSNPLILTFGISSCLFSMVPSTAISKFITSTSSYGARREKSEPVPKSVFWTIQLAGAIVRLYARFPQSTPCVAAYLDGFSYCLELLALFFLSVPPIHFDVKIQHESFGSVKIDLGLETWRSCNEAMIEADKVTRWDVFGASWIRFDSWALAAAIAGWFEDPEQEGVRPYRIFCHLMHALQGRKDLSTGFHRSDRHRSTTDILPDGEDDTWFVSRQTSQIADRCTPVGGMCAFNLTCMGIVTLCSFCLGMFASKCRICDKR